MLIRYFKKNAALLSALALALALGACSLRETVQQGPATAPPESAPPVESLTLVVTEADIARLDDYPGLKEVDLSGSTCYAAIADYMTAHPDVAVKYTVSLGGAPVDSSVTELTLAQGEYDYAALLENLKYLPELRGLSLPGTELGTQELQALRGAYPALGLDYTVELFGEEVESGAAELDLSALEPSQVGEAARVLALLPDLGYVELMDADGKSALTVADVKDLQSAAPGAAFHYTFELFGQTISTTDERVEYTDVEIGNGGEQQIRDALDILSGCTYFKLDDCGVSSEVMASIRADYPDTKVVWRVHFGYFSMLTDEETIRAIFDLNDDNCGELKYCSEVKYIDAGHNSELTDTSFIAHMPLLEICILSGSPFTDMTPFANCPNLEFLELVWCGNVSDLSPLQNCDKLKFLNITYTKVDDLSPVAGKPLERFCYYGSPFTLAEQEEFAAQHPDCWTSFDGANPYMRGWRYDDDAGGQPCEMYSKVREVFRYDENFYNHK